jgi:hypothetical protein
MAALAFKATFMWTASLGSRTVNKVDFVVTSYNSAGIIFTPAQVGLTDVNFVIPINNGAAAANQPVTFAFNGANGTTTYSILAYNATNSPVADGSTFNMTALIIGS